MNIASRFFDFFGIQKTGYRPASLSQEVSLGLLIGIEYILWIYTFASIIFIGELSSFLPVGVVMLLLGSGLLGLIVALTSSVPLHAATADEQAAAVLASIAIIMNSQLSDFSGTGAAAATLIVIIAATTLTFSLCLRLVVYFKVDILLQLIPFPVVCGFLGGLGWLLLDAGFNVTTDMGIASIAALVQPDVLAFWLPAFLCGFVIYVTTLYRQHILILPLSRLICFVGFYLIAYTFGASMGSMQEDGWLFDLSRSGATMGFGDLDFAGVNFAFIVSVLPQMATIVLLVLLSATFNLSGMEVGTRSIIPLRDELRRLGNANAASGLAMGLPGLTDIVVNITVHKAGVKSRIFPLVVAGTCLAAVLFGGAIIAYLPKFVIGTVIFFSAIQFAHEWLIVASRNMPRTEALVVWSIFGVIAAVGFIPGIILGILLSSLMFIIRYSNINVVDSSFSLNEVGSSVDRSQPEVRVLHVRGKEVKIFNLRGFLFFGSANLFFESFKNISEDSHKYSHFVFNFARVTGIDSTAVQVFLKIINFLGNTKIVPIICGLNPSIRQAFQKSGNFDENEILILDELDLALKWAEEQLLEQSPPDVNGSNLQEILETIFEDRTKAETMARSMSRCTYAKGEYIFHQGDLDTSLYVIESGVVEVRLEPVNSPPIRLREFRRGTIIGEMAAYSKQKSRSAAAVATEPTVAYQLSPDTLENMGDSAAAIRSILHEFVARLLVSRLAFMNKRLEVKL
jgi:SulP family sulfate permease